MKQAISDEKPLERYLKPGSFIYWQDHEYRILTRNPREITVEDVSLPEQEPRTIKVIDFIVPEEESGPVFASTLEQLRQKLAMLCPPQPRGVDAGLPQALRDKAEAMVKKYKLIEQLLVTKKEEVEREGKIFHRTKVLEEICQKDEIDIVVATYYNYRDRYREYSGDQSSIATSFRRKKSFGHARHSDALIHFGDSAIVHYYMRKPPITKATLNEFIKSMHKRTGGLWIDPDKCVGGVPQDLVMQLFNHKIPMQAILDNPEKRRLLVPIKEPPRTWVYDRVNALEEQPDEGKALITARYSEEMWEYEQKIFDHFAHIATRPLQYVFADYCLLKVFIVDEATRSEIDRLWLTLFIDAYSRSVLGMALTYEGPCIDTIQDALRNVIWPKTMLTDLHIEGEWPCYGIPLQVSLDNAWSNHSHSLESLASLISQKGEYSSIDLVFRKPYKARQGALIERFFGGLARIIKERLKGAIQSSHPKDVRNAAEEACLLYEDIYKFLLEEIVAYQNRPHSELNKMTPNQKWEQGLQSIPPAVPPLTKEVKRYFWREYNGTREINGKGISVFGMHYWSPSLGSKTAPKADQKGQRIKYGVRYDPSDISCIAIFRDGLYVDDVKAKELRLGDGQYRSVSLWELELSKDLAREDGQARRDWVAYLNEMRSLAETRTAEKKAAQRAARKQKLASSTSSQKKGPDVQKVDEAVSKLATPQDEEYRQRLARFAAH